MNRQLGRIELVSWQGHRPRDVRWLGPLDTALLAVVASSVCVLIIRFGAGLPMPIAWLQAAFALAVMSAALLAIRWIVAAILGLRER